MNFEFPPEILQMKDEARRVFHDSEALRGARSVLVGETSYDRSLWLKLAEMGFLGAAIPEAYGGAGAGELALCVLAEEAGRCVASVPLLSTVYLAADLICRNATNALKARVLPEIAAGRTIVGVVERAEKPATHVSPIWQDSCLSGVAAPVLDGGVADAYIVEARDASAGQKSTLIFLERGAAGVRVEDVTTIDPSRPQSRLLLDSAPGVVLGDPDEGRTLLDAACDKAAVLLAFEQLGGAERALEMAKAYALERWAFGRQIGSFQAIKHKLVDMYVAVTLARANAYYAAWALETNAPELAQAASIARISATDAFQLCSKENIQIHGGFGFTWDADCHLLYRRSSLLALTLRGGRYWRDRLIGAVRASNVPLETVSSH